MNGGMYINISDEAISREKTLRSEVIALHKDLYQGAKALITVYNENRAGLGYHDQIIMQLLEDLASESGETSKVAVLTKTLKYSAQNRQAHKDNPGYSKRR